LDDETISLGHKVKVIYPSGEEDKFIFVSSLDLLFLDLSGG